MTDFTFNSPDGKHYTVSGPSGATSAQAFQILQQQLKSKGASAATAAPKPQKPSLLNDVTAIPEAAASMAVNTLAPAGAAVESLATGKTSPEQYHQIKQSWEYNPKNPVAQQDLKAAGHIPVLKQIGEASDALAGAIASHLGKGVSKEEVSDALNTALLAVGGKEAATGDVAKKLVPDVAPKAVDAKEATTAAAQAKGLTVPLSNAKSNPSLLARWVEGTVGKTRTEDWHSLHNQPVMDSMIRKGLGIPPGTPITKELLQQVRDTAGKAYQAVRNISKKTITINPGNFVGKNFLQRLNDVTADYKADIREGNTNDITKDVDQLLNKPKTAKYVRIDVDRALSTIRNLRDEADTAYAHGEKALGKAKKNVAKALEQLIDDHMTATKEPPGMINSYRNARQTIAQTYAVQDALAGDGTVNAQKLASKLKKEYMSGALKEVGQFAADYPKAAKPVASLSNQVTTPIRTITSGVGASVGAAVGGTIGHPEIGAAVGGITAQAALPALRKAVTAKAFQKARTTAEQITAAAKQAARRNRLRKAARAIERGAAGGAAPVSEDQQSD